MTDAPETKPKDKGYWRDLVAYWILGLCNNYGYVVMLTAAHDIISKFEGNEHTNDKSESENSTARHCNKMSASAVLLADIIPSFLVKLLAPFMPFWVHVRMGLAVGLTVFSFVTVYAANAKWLAFLGIVFTSASCGIGESTLLAYSSSFNKNVVSTWSSGTGGAGILGALSYTVLIYLKLTPKQTMLVFLYVPTLEAVAFWVLLRHPKDAIVRTEEAEMVPQDVLTIREKILYFFKELLPFFVPLSLVYFAEYFINMGLYELVYFRNIFISPATQYRWFSTDYQIGVFISRSSVNLIHFTLIWPMAILQCINAIIFSFEAVFFFVPSFWIVIIFVLWEGLLGGGAYVNTFYHMSKVIPPQRRQYAIGMVAQADSYGIIAAGVLAFPVHNAICDSEERKRTMCGYEINENAFQEYSLETAKLYLSLYPWFYMTASVHKVLIHGALIIKACPLPIGMLSEEAQEARNKDFRHYRRDRSRKVSRVATNADVFHLMLASSDPIISAMRQTPKRFSGSLSGDVAALLKQTDDGNKSDTTFDSDSEDE